MRRWTEAEIDAAIQAVRGTMAMEGFTITTEEEELIRARLRGDLTDAEFLRLARERAVKAGPSGPPAQPGGAGGGAP
ncbi:MAG: antitoxin VbhA family protein [Armatimonadota bacterium]|nr:antitoxin VbhA family protein [Armatimonadota bacterium]